MGVGEALLVLQVLLAVTFGVAAVAKAFNPRETGEALVGFGVPQRLTPVLGPALTLIELALAIALLPFVRPREGAIAALVLLAGFSGAIAHNLVRGRAIDCRCFGGIRPRPISPGTLVRNALLMTAAAVIAGWGAGPSSERVAAWLAGRSTIELVLLASSGSTLAVLLVGGGYIVHVLRDHTRRLDALSEREGRSYAMPPPRGLPLGAQAPSFVLPAWGGDERSLSSLLAPGLPLVLVFLRLSCGSCRVLLPKLEHWRKAHHERLRVVLVIPADTEGERAPLDTLIDHDGTVSMSYKVMSTPSAVLVDPEGTIGAPLAIGEDAVAHLIEWAIK